MSVEGTHQQGSSDDAATEIDELVEEVQLLEKLKAGLQAQPDNATLVEAVEDVIEGRRAELDRTRRPDE